MSNWKIIIDKMESKPDKSEIFILELVNYQYGYIGWCLENDDKVQAKKYLKRGFGGESKPVLPFKNPGFAPFFERGGGC